MDNQKRIYSQLVQGLVRGDQVAIDTCILPYATGEFTPQTDREREAYNIGCMDHIIRTTERKEEAIELTMALQRKRTFLGQMAFLRAAKRTF